MRLQQSEATAIQKVIRKFFDSVPFELYLYGSRVHDHLRGGDIDLALLTSEAGMQLFAKMHLDILVHIKNQKEIGDRKIDLKAFTFNQLSSDPFLQHVSTDWILLTS